jgi:prepilin-type N-terminal cleavage/methylation domain-containing protein
MKNRSIINGGFTLIELIAVIAILSALLAVAVPNLSTCVKGAEKTACLTEARETADAIQRYIDDKKADGTLKARELRKVMSTPLNSPDHILRGYLQGGQRDARIVSLEVDVKNGILKEMVYENEDIYVKVYLQEDGTRAQKEVPAP